MNSTAACPMWASSSQSAICRVDQMQMALDLPYALDIRACACTGRCVHGSGVLVPAMWHIQLINAFVIVLTEQTNGEGSF